MSPDRASLAIVAVVLAVAIVSGHSVMGAVDKTMQQNAREWCNQHDGDVLVSQTNWGTQKEYLCILPNRTVVEWPGQVKFNGGAS